MCGNQGFKMAGELVEVPPGGAGACTGIVTVPLVLLATTLCFYCLPLILLRLRKGHLMTLSFEG